MQWDFKLGMPIKITASQYIDAFGVSRQTAYESLREACKTLFNRQFSYQEKSEEINGYWYKTSRWVSDIAYLNETATVSFTFAPAVLPLITELEQHLTSYELQQVANLSSAYAVRLYEVLIAWRSAGKTPKIKVADLRNRLGILKNEYERMSNFKSRVLEPSIKQINEHTDISVKYEQHKEGRTIEAFSFAFKVKKDNKKAVGNSKRDPDTPDLFTKMTDKQIDTFGAKLAGDTAFGSRYARAGESSQAFELRIKGELRDPDNQKRWAEDLKRVGFKPA